MKRAAVVIAALSALLVGGGIAIAKLNSADPKSDVFDAINAKSLLGSMEGVSWNVVDDSTMPAYPPLARPSRANRRFAATATIPAGEVTTVEAAITSRLNEILVAAGAATTGTGGHSNGEATVTEAGESRTRLVRLECRFYRVDDAHGVIETSLIAINDNVVLIVSVTE